MTTKLIQLPDNILAIALRGEGIFAPRHKLSIAETLVTQRRIVANHEHQREPFVSYPTVKDQ